MQQEYFTENKAIINEGDLGTCMYVLADGQLEVRKGKVYLKKRIPRIRYLVL